jgi:hypothetical protein
MAPRTRSRPRAATVYLSFDLARSLPASIRSLFRVCFLSDLIFFLSRAIFTSMLALRRLSLAEASLVRAFFANRGLLG